MARDWRDADPQWPLDRDPDDQPVARRKRGRRGSIASRLTALRGRRRPARGHRRSRWFWPGPLGGGVAIVLIALVAIAIPAAIATRATSGGKQPPAASAAPLPLGASAVPTPQFSVPGYPPQPAPAAPLDSPYPATPYVGPGPELPGSPDVPDPARPNPPPAGNPPAPAPPPPAPGRGAPAGSFVAVTGGGCPATANASYFAAYPAGSPVANRSGGWTGPGCTDRFWAVPMSGSSVVDDPDVFVLWWFITSPVTKGKCRIWAYVPKSANDDDVAGDPTAYQVLRSRENQTIIGSFKIRQPKHRGEWVEGGSFKLDGGRIAVKLRNRGSGEGGARHAAAQIVVSCKP